MKNGSLLVLGLLMLGGPANAMKMVDSPIARNSAAPTQSVLSGKIDSIHAAASKIVIKGETYAYNPLSTVVMVDGKRATMSDLKVGDSVQFQATAQAAGKPSMLSTITVNRR